MACRRTTAGDAAQRQQYNWEQQGSGRGVWHPRLQGMGVRAARAVCVSPAFAAAAAHLQPASASFAALCSERFFVLHVFMHQYAMQTAAFGEGCVCLCTATAAPPAGVTANVTPACFSCRGKRGRKRMGWNIVQV